ncbi:hypothetical protein [Parapedobacter sp. DT-150]|uniref:hypothetical protein n=1 Tax=Parapedobacter sp. DT-150 TaxID=3396162 RepID=UPI003F1B23C5
MKTFVLSTLIAVATAGNAWANQVATPRLDRIGMIERSETGERVDAFKSQMAFHQRNVAVLWNQYASAAERIRNSRGSHAELDRDRAFFAGVYQQDIDKGIRVDESKRAIADIEARYALAHVERDAYEAERIASLQAQLKTAMKKEAKKFMKAKRKNAELVNAELLPLVQEVEAYITQSIDRAEHLAAGDEQRVIAVR